MQNLEKVIMQLTQQPCMRLYNVRYELTDSAAEDGCRGSIENLGEFGHLVMEIRGIEVVRIQPYRIFISKAALFSWDEIEPSVIKLLESFNLSQDLLAEDFTRYAQDYGATVLPN